MTTQTIERPAQAQTCATCPFFNEHQGMYGWCDAFDHMARPCHERTAACDQEIATLEATLEREALLQSEAALTSQLESKTPPAKSATVEWTTTYNSCWGWYDVWVGRKWVGRASTHKEAERVAQKYVAINKMIQQQNESVLAKYAN